jgi:hypothetical protein
MKSPSEIRGKPYTYSWTWNDQRACRKVRLLLRFQVLGLEVEVEKSGERPRGFRVGVSGTEVVRQPSRALARDCSSSKSSGRRPPKSSYAAFKPDDFRFGWEEISASLRRVLLIRVQALQQIDLPGFTHGYPNKFLQEFRLRIRSRIRSLFGS